MCGFGVIGGRNKLSRIENSKRYDAAGKPKISHWRFRLESAIARVIAEGKVRTYDKGGSASTLPTTQALSWRWIGVDDSHENVASPMASGR